MTIAIPRTQLRLSGIQLRYRLVAGGLFTVILSLAIVFQATIAYSTAYGLFNDIAVKSTVKVDSSISALQHLATINKYAADLIGYTQVTDQQQALTNVQSEFQNFRDQMFTIRNGLSKPEEFTAYNAAEKLIYNDYWEHIIKIIDARSNNNKEVAVNEFNLADQVFEERITTSMATLGQMNYTSMLEAKANASRIILSQAFLLGAMGIGLAVFLTGLSIWLRWKIRRYLTPGIDLAAILSVLLTVIMVFQLAQLPEQLRVMVQDAYYSVTASARVISDASRANITESAALNDPANASQWQQKFDHFVQLVTLRICGQQNCLVRPFSKDGQDNIDPAVAQIAKAVTQQDSIAIDNIIPLMGNITFTGEVTTLEQARLAYLDYLQIDKQTRGLLANNQLEEAIKLNTGRNPGQSDEAFFRFISLMEQEETINRNVFQQVWTEQQTALPLSQLLYGNLGLIIVILLSCFGVYHRFREL